MKRLALLFFVLLVPTLSAQRLSPLANRPDWSALDRFQESITHDDFLWLLENVYAPDGAWKPFIEVSPSAAVIQARVGEPPYVLRFASSTGTAKPFERYWREKAQLSPRSPKLPLAGIRIAIDPGHLGGQWARVEERWFKIGNSKPVAEGNMTLHVAKLLYSRLRLLGADVYLTRSTRKPVTSLRPGRSLAKEATLALDDRAEPVTPQSLKSEGERLFYRVGEIRQRAVLVNETIKPDLVLCLHFNAEAWGNPNNPDLTDVNHLHFLVTGAFSVTELSYEDQRFNMLQKLLSRAYREELAVTEAVAAAMAKETGLPPYQYITGNALRVGSSPYVWARNLLANRLFECPVVYVEPYVMNSRDVFARLQAGDYDGRKPFGGVMRQSIYREYADGIVKGLVDYYSSTP